MRLILHISTSVLIPLFIVGCSLFGEEPDDTDYANIWDPTSPFYIPPATVIDQDPGDRITTHTTTIKWHSSRTDVGAEDTSDYKNIQWSYRLNDAEFSAPAKSGKVTYTLLSDTVNTFEIKTVYPSGDVEDPPTRLVFRVDEVDGSSMMFYPRKNENAEVGSPIQIDVIAEEVTGLTGAKITISYDPDSLRIDNVVPPQDTLFILLRHGGSPLFLYSDSIAGYIEINMAVAGVDPFAVTGTGPITTLTVTPLLPGQSVLRFTNDSRYRDEENAEIPILRKVAGVIIAN